LRNLFRSVIPATAVVGLCLVSAAGAQSIPPQAAPGVWRDKVRSFASANFKHPAWGYSHCLRDYDLARQLAAEDHVVLDDDVLFGAAFVHDIAAFPKWDAPKQDHSDRGAEVVGPLLEEMGFPKEKLPAVQDAIRTHMYYRKPEKAEALYLHDADALDWLGAIGIARAFARVDPNGGRPDAASMAEWIEKDLRDVPSKVFSAPGQARLPAVLAEMRKFMDSLRSQTSNLKAL